MMLQHLEGTNRGAAVFNHWKVHNGSDYDLINRNGSVLDGVGDDGDGDDTGDGDGVNSTDAANSDGSC